MNRVFVIAEAGVNHNGDLILAKRMIDLAHDSGADAVKFQTWNTESLVSKKARQAAYQIKNLGYEESQFQLLKKLELTHNQFIELRAHCDFKGIIFMSTPDDIESAQFLNPLQDIYKIGSGAVDDLHLLEYIGSLRKRIIMSTGMSTYEEIEAALNVLEKSGTDRNHITLLHCTSEYPAPYDEVNLLAMNSIKKRFGIEVGYSDHTLGIEVSLAAAALGAKVIEKHFTTNLDLPGPDHKASIDFKQLKNLVAGIRLIEKSLGNSEKKVTPSELRNKHLVRKVIVAKLPINRNEILTNDNLTTKRAGFGASPMMWKTYLGKKANRNYSPDEPIDLL